MGLNSGEVVVGAIGDDLRMDYTALGHTVGLASRIEELAEPGKAYLTEYTAELASGYFELEDLGEFTIKGVSKPVRVFELSGIGAARSRLDIARAGILSLRRARSRDGDPRRGARARDRGRGQDRRRRGRARRREEPPLLRVRRALPGSRPLPSRGARRFAWQRDPVPARPGDAPRVLRDHRSRRRREGS